MYNVNDVNKKLIRIEFVEKKNKSSGVCRIERQYMDRREKNTVGGKKKKLF
jgi:hypothetical protein